MNPFDVMCVDFEFSTDKYKLTPCVATCVWRGIHRLFDLLDENGVRDLTHFCMNARGFHVVGFGMSNDMQIISYHLPYFCDWIYIGSPDCVERTRQEPTESQKCGEDAI